MTNRRRRRIRRIQKIKTRSKQIICIPAFKVLIRIRLECRVEYVILQRESCCYCCWMLLPFFVVLFCSARFFLFLFVYLSWRSLSAANVTHLLSIPTVDKQCYYYMYVVYIYISNRAQFIFKWPFCAIDAWIVYVRVSAVCACVCSLVLFIFICQLCSAIRSSYSRTVRTYRTRHTQYLGFLLECQLATQAFIGWHWYERSTWIVQMTNG